MSKIKNDRLDQYGAGPSEQQQFGTAGVEGVKNLFNDTSHHLQQPVLTSDDCMIAVNAGEVSQRS